jgi:regulatory protein
VEPRRRSPAQRRADAEARRAKRSEVTDPEVVMEAAAVFLAVRQRSVAETRRRLRRLGYPVAVVETVIGRLVGVGYLDDAAFAQAWVESRDRARPRGAVVLRQELRARGIAEETIRLVLAERHAGTGSGPGPSGATGDIAAARRLLDRRAAALAREADPGRRRHKAYALLARNGFDPDVCAVVVRDALVRTSDPGPDNPGTDV